jgi:hypothetical protein
MQRLCFHFTRFENEKLQQQQRIVPTNLESNRVLTAMRSVGGVRAQKIERIGWQGIYTELYTSNA